MQVSAELTDVMIMKKKHFIPANLAETHAAFKKQKEKVSSGYGL